MRMYISIVETMLPKTCYNHKIRMSCSLGGKSIAPLIVPYNHFGHCVHMLPPFVLSAEVVIMKDGVHWFYFDIISRCQESFVMFFGISSFETRVTSHYCLKEYREDSVQILCLIITNKNKLMNKQVVINWLTDISNKEFIKLKVRCGSVLKDMEQKSGRGG